MSEIYRSDNELEKELYNKEYVKHVEARKRKSQLRREQQIKKNRMLSLIAGVIVVVLVVVLICCVSCSHRKESSKAETTTPEVTTMSEIATEETTLVAMYTIDVLNLRTKPNTKSEVIDQIGAGKKVEIISEEGKWCKVKRGKDEGYVMKKYLSYTNTLN